MLCVCSTGLWKGCTIKEAIDSFFRRAVPNNSWKSMMFRISVSFYGVYYTGLSTIDATDGLFGKAPQEKPWKEYNHFLVSCYKIWSKIVF